VLLELALGRALIIVVGLLLGFVAGMAQDNAEEFFERRVRPVLAAKCYGCDTSTKLGGLQVDSREALLIGGKSGPAIIPGNPEASSLIRAIKHTDPKLKMPMAGEKLNEQQISDLRSGIQSGAPWPASSTQTMGFHITSEQKDFWSFQKLRKAEPPAVKNIAWVQNPIDRFILAKIEQSGQKPAAPADKRVLIRRNV